MSDRNRHDDRPAGARGDDPVRNDLDTGGTRPDDFRLERIAPDEAVQGAQVGEARLEGIAGVGTLQVTRDREGNVLHVEGTWRPDDEGTDPSAIDAALEAGRPLRYEGTFDDPARPERNRCEAEVVVTSRSTYTWDARKEDDGRTLPLYNFRPRDGEAVDR